MHTAIDAFVQHLRVERNSSPLTVKSYAEDLESLLAFFDHTAEAENRTGPPEPTAVTIGTLRAYVSYLHECDYARTTIARRLACVRSFFRFLRRTGVIEANPAQALRTPRTGRKLPHFLSVDGATTLLEAPPGDTPAGLRDRAILEVFYSAGLRVAELVSLDLPDWDREAGIVRVTGKGRKERLAPIGRHATAALDRWVAVRTPRPNAKPAHRDAVFLNRLGTRLTTRSVGRMVEKYLKIAGLDPRTRRTRCGTPSPRTCSTAGPTCAACKSCSPTRA